MSNKIKVNFSQALRALDGSPLMEGETLLTLGKVAAAGLNQPPRQGSHETAVQAARRGRLALRLWDAGEIDIDPEEAVLIRDWTREGWATVVVAQVHAALGFGGD